MKLKLNRVNPSLAVTFIGLVMFFLASIFNAQAKQPLTFKKNPKTSSSEEASFRVDVDPELKAQIFANATELLLMMRSVGLDQLSDYRNGFKVSGPASVDLVLKRNGFTPLNTHGDVGMMLAVLLTARENQAGDFTAEELKVLYFELKANEKKLTDATLMQLFQEWKTTLPRDLKLSNNESMQFKNLLKKPW